MPSQPLICDIGGTNARFALAGPGGVPQDLRVFHVADHPRFGDALRAYLDETGIVPTSAAIAAAGPVADGAVSLTNAPWEIRAAEVSAALGGIPVDVFNDLEAVAFALPHLTLHEFEIIRAGMPRLAAAPLLALNVGTGFGAAVAVPDGAGWTVLATEAGHMHLDARPLTDAAVTVEDVFSGPGFRRFRPPNAADAIERRSDYSHLFGRVVRDMILATGAWGGVHLCGGVLDDFASNIRVSSFLEGLVDDGPMAERLRIVPVCRITLDAPALRGLAARCAP